MRVLISLCCMLLLSACLLNGKVKSTKTVNMYNATGDMVGTARLIEHPDGVNIKLKVEGLSPGFHGVHIHEIAKCEGPDFQSAGNHLNPDEKKHGLLHPDGAHLGDLPNVEADNEGKVDANITAQDMTLLKGEKSLTDRGGTSIIVTSKADDGMTQISGDAGERIICGEIKRGDSDEDREEPSDPTDMEEDE